MYGRLVVPSPFADSLNLPSFQNFITFSIKTVEWGGPEVSDARYVQWALVGAGYTVLEPSSSYGPLIATRIPLAPSSFLPPKVQALSIQLPQRADVKVAASLLET